jgi:uncharacterized membrane protein YqjE
MSDPTPTHGERLMFGLTVLFVPLVLWAVAAFLWALWPLPLFAAVTLGVCYLLGWAAES